MTIHELLLQRFATKQFDAAAAVSDDDLAYILEAGRLSASSYNIQPWHFTVVTNPELRATIRNASYGQAQVTEASALIVISAMRTPSERVHQTAALISAAAGAEKGEAYTKMVLGDADNRPEGSLLPWMQRQVYLPLQAMMLAAAEHGLDTCPMEGFDPGMVAEALGHTGTVPTVFLAVGRAAAPGGPKVRLSTAQIVEWRK